MNTVRQFWRASWLGILLIGLGILLYLDNTPNYKGIFFPGLLILIGILLLIGGVIRASTQTV
ncbi:MAG: hypothetical protein ACQXXH_07585 [Candidatus Bathyarchaeia archaeon]|jgi:uncharacterized membrane protein HdeD (DUF308 family)|nr:hypothetical protein [Candidatus Bathyarchaeota archaeon A05DMB-4]MDH7595873.1 hypothetical protein [Candidatus Bathyarchaeota archaeon]